MKKTIYAVVKIKLDIPDDFEEKFPDEENAETVFANECDYSFIFENEFGIKVLETEFMGVEATCPV